MGDGGEIHKNAPPPSLPPFLYSDGRFFSLRTQMKGRLFRKAGGILGNVEERLKTSLSKDRKDRTKKK